MPAHTHLLVCVLVLTVACDDSSEDAERPPAPPAGTTTESTDAPDPVPPPQPEALIASAIFAGHDSTCAIVEGDGLVCWGRGWAPDVTPRLPRAMGIQDATSASIAGAHACAVDGAGVARCWGEGIRGELGNGERTMAGERVTAGLSDVAGVAVSNGASCFLERSGAVRCAGAYAQLGHEEEVASVAPVAVEGIDDAEQLVSGWQHYCVRRRNGRVSCWGSGQMGQMGQGTQSEALAPVEVPGLRGVVDLTAGSQFVCALDGDGAAKCWGANWFGQLGAGENELCRAYGGKPCRMSPAAVPGLEGVVDLEAGAQHVCARHEDGAVSCWGLAADGAIGPIPDDAEACPERTGNDAHCSRPLRIEGLTDVVELAAGQEHTCARTEEGEVHCWGSNDQLQLGARNGGRRVRVAVAN